MKKHLFILAFLFLCSYASFAQTPVKLKDVPVPVLKSYHSHNSNGAKDSVWTKHIMTTYTVSYMDEGKPYQAMYMEDGSWIKTITEIPVTQLSPDINTQIAQLYPDYSIVKSFIELNAAGKFYTVDLERGKDPAKMKDKATAHFLMNGKHVK